MSRGARRRAPYWFWLGGVLMAFAWFMSAGEHHPPAWVTTGAGGLGGALVGAALAALFLPPKPHGVRLRSDDLVVELDKRLWYAGRNVEGVRVWRCWLLSDEIVMLKCGEAVIHTESLPPRTLVSFEMSDDD